MAKYAVIGAGAAGISAARELQAAAHEVAVFEARDRPGGRVWTDYSIAGHPVELGAEFIHGERVSTWDWVREFDAPITGEAHSYEMWLHLAGKLMSTPEARAHIGTDPLFALQRLAARWQKAGRPDAPLSDVLELWPELSEKPLTPEGRALLENYIAELAASDISELGSHRYDAGAPADRGLEHFRLLDGYTSLMQQAVSGLDVRYSTPVSKLRWDDHSVEVTAGGAAATYAAAVVTLPLGILKKGVIEFDPGLPAEKLDAISRINAGSISKVVLKFDRVYWPVNLTFLWTPLSTQLWWRPGQGQASEEPVLTAFFGGSAARALEGASTEEATEYAVSHLSEIVGKPLAAKVQASRYISWGAEEHTQMGYSSLPMNGRGLREALGSPVGALYFAGEATSLTHAATVDGAIDSGRRAAAEILGVEC